MENIKIKDKILYANISNNGQREVREARFVELYSRFYDMRWNGIKCETCPLLSYLNDYSFKLEIAGIGILSHYELKKIKGMLYLSESDACLQKNAIWRYEFDSLYLDFFRVYLPNLKVRNDKFRLFDNPDRSFKELRVESWYWDGTKPSRVVLPSKFQYDFINDRYVENTNNDCKYDNRKLYATKEMCESDNTPTIVRFDNKPKEVEKIVTFEISTSVVVNASEMPECEEEDAIVKAMEKIRACDDEVLFDACTSCTNKQS